MAKNLLTVDDGCTAPAVLEIRRNADGVIRRSPGHWHFYGDFIWENGKFSCDCNRARLFAEAGGEIDAEMDCGHGAFSVRIMAVDDAEMLYCDGEGW
jgi:hypothetical protein